MMVYHGSLEKITQPEIREPNRTLDYGSGFYTTTSGLRLKNGCVSAWTRKKQKKAL